MSQVLQKPENDQPRSMFKNISPMVENKPVENSDVEVSLSLSQEEEKEAIFSQRQNEMESAYTTVKVQPHDVYRVPLTYLLPGSDYEVFI